MAFRLIRATGAFAAVIHTEGNDLEHLMHGMSARYLDVVVLGRRGRIGAARRPGETTRLGRRHAVLLDGAVVKPIHHA